MERQRNAGKPDPSGARGTPERLFFRYRFTLRRNPVDRFRVNDGNALQLIYKILEIGKFRFERDDALFGFNIRKQLLITCGFQIVIDCRFFYQRGDDRVSDCRCAAI